MIKKYRTLLLRLVRVFILIPLTIPLIFAFLMQTDGLKVSLLGSPIDPGCAFKDKTGVPCASCGLTRSWVYMAHANYKESSAMNPHGPTTFGAYLYMVLAFGLLLYLLGRNHHSWTWFVWLLFGSSLILATLAFMPVIEKNVALQDKYAE